MCCTTFSTRFSFVAGWLADHVNKRELLSGGYALAGSMGLVLVFVPLNLPTLAAVFVWTLAEERLIISGETRFLILVGFMGAFTTFSTFAFETSGMLSDAEWR